MNEWHGKAEIPSRQFRTKQHPQAYSPARIKATLIALEDHRYLNDLVSLPTLVRRQVDGIENQAVIVEPAIEGFGNELPYLIEIGGRYVGFHNDSVLQLSAYRVSGSVPDSRMRRYSR